MNCGLCRLLAAASAVLALAGCASAPGARNDPLEPMNRAVFAFNEAVDDAVLKPVATAYQKVVPELVRTGVDNVFANIGDLWSAANQLLQAKPVAAVEMGFRFVVNSSFGIGGLFDIASEAGLERRSEDFGQTLGRWGLGTGPYLVLPLLGPSNVRDGAGHQPAVVEQHHDGLVALHPIRPHDRFAGARCGRPVKAAGLIVAGVVAQRVELGATPP